MMTEEEIVKLRQEAADEGYTEEEIQQYIQSQQPYATTVEPKPIDRTEEQQGVTEGIGYEAAKKGIMAVGGGYAAKKLIYDPLMNKGAAPGPAPVAPSSMPQTPPAASGAIPRGPMGPSPAQQTFEALSRDYSPAQQRINPQAFAEQRPMTPQSMAGPEPMSRGPAQIPPGTPAQSQPIPRGPVSAAAPEAPPTAQNYIARMQQLARTYAPIAARAAGGIAAAVTPGNMLQNTGEDEEMRRRRKSMGINY